MAGINCIVIALLWLTNPVIEEFTERVKKYSDLQEKIDDSLPKVKKEEDPNVIIKREEQFKTAIRSARQDAAAGDIFIPAVRPIFKKIIKEEISGAQGKRARQMVLGEGNPKSPESPARVDLTVNGHYPTKAPLSTMPPSLLLRLPQLPEGIEYRFVGRTLILFDPKANLIIDLLPDAVSYRK
jgi:hypothetical protein